jgi:hypothetical protein
METPSISVAGLSSSVGAVPSSTAPRQPLPPLEAAPTLPARLASYLLAAAYRIDAVLWCVLAALSMGCWESLRLALSARGSLGWLGDAWSSLGHAGIVLGTVILGAGLWTAYSEARRVRRARSGDGGFVHALCSSVRDGRVCCTDGGCCTDERRFLALACANQHKWNDPPKPLPTREEALDWAARIAKGCRCAQEVREIMFDPES